MVLGWFFLCFRWKCWGFRIIFGFHAFIILRMLSFFGDAGEDGFCPPDLRRKVTTQDPRFSHTHGSQPAPTSCAFGLSVCIIFLSALCVGK